MNLEVPLVNSLIPTINPTEFGKNQDSDKELDDLTKISKVEIRNHYSDDFIDVDKKMDLGRQESIKNHNKPSKSTIAENNEQLYIKSREKINNCNTRAGGLAWLRYRLDMAGVVGSNPTRPISYLSIIIRT